jgi:hypothetical protein
MNLSELPIEYLAALRDKVISTLADKARRAPERVFGGVGKGWALVTSKPLRQFEWVVES